MENRLIAFLDILGFSALVERIEKDTCLKGTVLHALERIASFKAEAENMPLYKVSSFSDCLIISEGYNASPTHFLSRIIGFSEELSELGIWLRGSVVYGNIHHSDTAVFGSGVNKAYRIESTIADFPRILVSKQVRDEAYRLNPVVANRMIRQSSDGPYHLHTLLKIDPHWVVWFAGPEIERRKEDALRIKNFITEQLNESVDNPRVFRKIRWLAEYYNKTVAPTVLHGLTWIPGIELDEAVLMPV